MLEEGMSKKLNQLKMLFDEKDIVELTLAELFLIKESREQYAKWLQEEQMDVSIVHVFSLAELSTSYTGREIGMILRKSMESKPVLNKILRHNLFKEYSLELFNYSFKAAYSNFAEKIITILAENLTSLQTWSLPAALADLMGALCKKEEGNELTWIPYGGIGVLPVWVNRNGISTVFFSEMNERIRDFSKIIYYLCTGEIFTEEDWKPFSVKEDFQYENIVGVIPFGMELSRNAVDEKYLWPLRFSRKYTECLLIWDLCQHLDEQGKGIFLVPKGVLSREGNEKRLRRILVENGWLENVIYLPPRLLSNTPVPSAILVVHKGNTKEKIGLIDIEKNAEWYVNGRRSELNRWAVSEIAEMTVKGEGEHPAMRMVSAEVIREKDYNLNSEYYFEAMEDADNSEEGEEALDILYRDMEQARQEYWESHTKTIGLLDVREK